MSGYRNRPYRRPPPPPKPRPANADQRELEGVVETIVFRSEDTGYTVCSVRLAEGRDPVTVVGRCPAVWVGENLRATGAWARHKQHGYQFEAQTIMCIAPTSAKGIERYLASGMIRGIGKVHAERIVKHFGQDTLRVIEKESQRLQEVEGIGPKRRRMLKESWNEQRTVRDIMIFLQSHGVGTAQAARIYRQYGAAAVAKISENPYRLCSDIWGIGFKTADGVAQSIGIPTESEIRARAGLIYVLQSLMDDGHCFCPAPELILQAQALLDIPPEVLAEAINVEVAAGRLIREQDNIYLAGLHAAEVTVAEHIERLLQTPAAYKPIDTHRAVPWAAEHMRITFAPAQKKALQVALSRKVSIITGGPGVGKTTIIRALVDVYARRHLKVLLGAPTGRAAKRMAEATHHDARTLHRMLKYMPKDGTFFHGEATPIEGDVFILDEVSMIDVRLMCDVLSALPDAATLILVGDQDQLPSVGPGNVLADLIQSGVIPCTRLDHIFRQETGGLIVRNAHHVNHGEPIEKPPRGDQVSDFYFIETQDPDQVISRMLDLVRRRIPGKFGFDPLSDIQVLTPMRRNQLGADNLNAILQEALNRGGAEVERFGRTYREGDRVMQIRNNYDKEVYNGDIGHIREVDTVDQQVIVLIDDRRVKYEFSELDELVHAYACSIHKSQGSEYPAVVILLTTQHFKLLQRNLLYTAITRGKKLVCLVGSSKAVFLATRNNDIRLRRTTLALRLKGRL